MMEYKGYVGKVEYDDEAGILHGDVINIRDVITFQGKTVDEIKSAFIDSVEDYLDFCGKLGKSPAKPYSGQFITHLNPELHRKISLAAESAGMSLNAWVEIQLGLAMQEEETNSSTSETKVEPETEPLPPTTQRTGRRLVRRAGQYPIK